MSTAAATITKFHLSLNVSNLERSVAFYRVLFGIEPAKRQVDYAKFELDEPPVVLSLIPIAAAPGGAMNHIGIRFADAETMVAAQARLEAAGHPTEREEGVECCYARQTKFWITDPDRTLWEMYVLHEDIDHAGMGGIAPPPQAEGCCQTEPRATSAPLTVLSSAAPAERPKATWMHTLLEPLPERIAQTDDSLDTILLEGTFNMAVDDQRRMAFLREAFRALKPRGELVMHGLTSDLTLSRRPKLPGPASFVEHVMTETDAAAALEQAGFVDLEVTTLRATPCFTAEGAELRETRIAARKPAAASGGRHVVMYRGPARAITDDAGREYPRGQRVTVDAAALVSIQDGALASRFVVFASPATGSCCGH